MSDKPLVWLANRFILFSAGVVFVALSTPLVAQQWENVVSAANGTRISYDAASLIIDGQSAKLWVKLDFTAVRDKSDRSSTELWKYNCTNDTFMALSITRYLRNGAVSYNRTYPDSPSLFDPVVPGTLSAAVKQVACFSKDAYTIPRTDRLRAIKQVVLPSREEAQALVDQVVAGSSFETATQAIGFSARDIDWGNRSKAEVGELTSEQIATHLFSFSKVGMSQPIPSELGWHVFFVRRAE